MILVGNQKDLEKKREVTNTKAEEFRMRHNIDYFVETSAKTGENVEILFTMAGRLLYERFNSKFSDLVS